MIKTQRNLRPGKAMGITADPVVRAALLSELVRPSTRDRALWLISAWISDVEVIDNSYGAYDALLGDEFPSVVRLSHVLGAIHRRGTSVHVVTKRLDWHLEFERQVKRATDGGAVLHFTYDDAVHEKTLCTNSWMIEGSMNFTYNGLGVNDESVNYTIDRAKTGKALLDFSARWERQ